MGISTFPNVASPIKSIQRGSAATAGSITITAVKTSRTTVSSFSTSSSGTVQASGTVAAGTSNATGYASKFGFSATLGTVDTTRNAAPGSYPVSLVDQSDLYQPVANYNAQTAATYNTDLTYNAAVYTPSNYVGQYVSAYYTSPRYGVVNTAYNSAYTNASSYAPSNVATTNYTVTSYNANTANYNTYYLAKPLTGSYTNSAVAISGGSTNLVSAVNGAYLSDATTLVVTGPCRYEVVEYY